MPNPYDDIFDDNEKEKKSLSDQDDFSSFESEDDDRFQKSEIESLDEILIKSRHFQKEAEAFSKLLTKTSAIDHKVLNRLTRIFVSDKTVEPKSLEEERDYHALLVKKFNQIIPQMKDLAKIHLEIVKLFNQDIDKDYYSLEKTDGQIKAEVAYSINALNMQRKILADGANDLEVLEGALIETERRIKAFINAGGINNISSAEFEIITQKRSTLTSGLDHQFNYAFFDINLLDKTVIKLGMYMKETTSQYLGKLVKAFDMS